MKGQRLSLADVKSDAYVVGAINDHIVPWPASYKTTRLMGGDVRYVLSSGGHIAGIVNPPGPKAWYEEAKPPYPVNAAQWRCGRGASQRVLVGGLDQVGAARAGRRPTPRPWAANVTRRSPTRPGSYVHG